MPEVSLHQMDRHPVIEQFGGPGVPQPVGLAEPQRAPRAVGEARLSGQSYAFPAACDGWTGRFRTPMPSEDR